MVVRYQGTPRARSFDWDLALKFYREGKTYETIARLVGATPAGVRYAIRQMREELGEDKVPRRRKAYGPRTPKPKPKKKKLPEHKHGEPVVTKVPHYEPVTTWASAFKVLAHRLRKTGDEEGWEMAQTIAKEKGMTTL